MTSGERLEVAIAEYANSPSARMRELARKHDVARETLRSELQRRKLMRPGGVPVPPATLDASVNLYRSGSSIRSAAIDSGILQKTLRRELIRRGIEINSRRPSGEDHYRWSGDEATDSAKHKRLHHIRGVLIHPDVKTKYGRGPFVSYICIGCGKWAQQWARIHGRSGLDPFLDFIPLCTRCHVNYDWYLHFPQQQTPEGRKRKSEGCFKREDRKRIAAGNEPLDDTEISRRYDEEDWTMKELASEYGVCSQTIRRRIDRMVSNHTYEHI